MIMSKNQTCCFTGHRKLPKEKVTSIVNRLNCEVDKLLGKGVRNFISGGALGFDQIAARHIILRKEMGSDIRLLFALPCKNQDAFWNDDQKKLYHSLLAKADKIIYVSEKYTRDCMKKRNRLMVDKSDYCICAQLYPTGGTVQTLKYALKTGVKVINVARLTNER